MSTAEVTTAQTANIDAARAFLASLGEHLSSQLSARVSTARATLAARHADTSTLTLFDRIHTHIASMAATCESGVEHLDAYHGNLEQAVNATPEAADTDFYCPDASASGGASTDDQGGPGPGADVDIGPGALWLGDVNAGVVSWGSRGPAGGRRVEIEDGDGEFAGVGLTREQMRELRDRLAATLAGEPGADARMAADDGTLSWRADGDGRYRLRADTGDGHCEVILTGAQMQAVQEQIAADLAGEDAAAATFPGVTGRLADKHAGVSYDNDSALTVPHGALTDEQLQACGRAVRLYRNSTYRQIGAHLRGGDDEVMQIREYPGQTDATAEPVSEHVAKIDQAMQAAPLDQPLTLWRGVHDLPLVVGTEPDKDLTGIQWTEQSFPSTSIDPKIASIFTGDDTLLRLHVPAGTGAIQLDSRPTALAHNREAEVLLQRGLQMRIIADQRQTVDKGHTAGQQDAPPREYRVLDVEVTVPKPAVPEPAVPEPGRSAEEIVPPNGGWGIDQGLMHFDGALGRLWNTLGDDKHLEVDGHALGNIITDLGEGITLRRHDTNHALRELRRIRTHLPDSSTAAQRVDVAIGRLNAPDRPAPALPDKTPQQLKDLMADLNAIPLVRRGYDEGSGGVAFHETDQLAEVTRRWMNGEIHRSQLERELEGMLQRRHESSEGWTEIKVAVGRALTNFRQWAKRPS
ncbi:ADP-ribosyltransferase [Paractinoplanes atraurantiacus]|uniref:ADP-ribosyltransferase exoenzyme n=1 Tax=Paractinoplanes atraurantiacus TaxID=1036182 RepID=A0A285KL18_9ACTN|nr:ADP-ribosyltransferase [Actinoplanes atraurantiacus]SNY72913.1 ADP-ribosyltransferase exoenzyme [Actinoplanes atraurantiacus]